MSTGDRSRGQPAPSGVRQLGGFLATVLAPASIVTGLGAYFGFLHTHSYYRYLNIDASVLSFTTTDYLLRSVNGFLPLLVVLLVVSLAAALAAPVARRAITSSPRVRFLARLLVVGGVILALVPAGRLAGWWSVPSGLPRLLLPAMLGLGASCAWIGRAVAIDLASTPTTSGATWADEPVVPRTDWSGAIAAAVLLVASVWAVTLDADARGTTDARRLVAALASRPAVVVTSARPLGLPLPEHVTTTPDGSLYRYTGSRLVLRAGDRYLLLSDGWTRATGWSMLIDDDPDVRVDLAG